MAADGMIAVLASSAAVQGLGAVVDLVGMLPDLVGGLGELGQWYDEALLLGRQWERNVAALEHYAGGENEARRVVAAMWAQTGGSIEQSALAGMAAEAVRLDVSRDTEQIAALARVAWVRGGVSLTGAPESAAERTAEVFEDLLGAIKQQDVEALTSWGFEIDQSRLQGLMGRERQDELLAQVLGDAVAKELGALDAFRPSPYERVAARETDLAGTFGRAVSDYSLGFWGDLATVGAPGPMLLTRMLMEYQEALTVPSAPPDLQSHTSEWASGGGGGGAGGDMPIPVPAPVPNVPTPTPAEAPKPSPQFTPVPQHLPTLEVALGDADLAAAREAADRAVAEILQRVQDGITEDVVKELALRRLRDGPLPPRTSNNAIQDKLREVGIS